MKRVIKLTEDDLTRIIKRVLVESDNPADIASCVKQKTGKDLPESCVSLIPTEIPTGGTPPMPDTNKIITCLTEVGTMFGNPMDPNFDPFSVPKKVNDFMCSFLGCTGSMCSVITNQMDAALEQIPAMIKMFFTDKKFLECCGKSGESFGDWISRRGAEGGGGGYNEQDYTCVTPSDCKNATSGNVNIKMTKDGSEYCASYGSVWEWGC